MRVAAYIRVSRVGGRQGERFLSPTLQRERIAAWASGHEVVEWLEDLDQPGSRLDRPGLTRAMELVESGQVAGIVVAKLDRFGRSVVHQAALLERLREAGAALFTVGEGIDTRSSTGKLVADIIGAIGEWELGRIRENWAAARAAAKARGAHLGEAPFGFDKLKDGRLEATGASRFVGETFRRRVSGDSWATIARWLNGEGIASRRGGQWTVASVRRMVGNRVYVEQGIVSPATFEAANGVRGVAPARSGRASGLLSGLLRCAGCRYAMKLSQGRTRHGRAFTEYRCKSSRGEAAGGRCEAPAAIKSTVIEPFVMQAFWLYVADYQATGTASDTQVEKAARDVQRGEAELDAALDRRLVDALGGDDSAAYLALVRERREAVEMARATLANTTRQAISLPDINFRDLWPDLSLYEQRKLLASALDCVFVRRGGQVPVGERTWLCLHGEAPELPTRGRRWTPVAFEFPASAEAGA